jgi:hypothetical protein
MKHRTFALTSIALAAIFPSAAAVCGAGCIDLTPVVLSDDGADTGAPDVALEDAGDTLGDVDLRSKCVRCVEGETEDSGVCAFEIVTCENDPLCREILACAVASGCLELKSASEVVGCGLPCAQEAGLRSQYDPPAIEILDIVACGQKRCVGSCAWSTPPK